jgi:hydrogenase assembly chaperone HypC/HupF
MCIAYPARVVSVEPSAAMVDMGGRRRRAALLLEPNVAPGDWVLVGAGTVLRQVSAAEARDLARTLDAAISTTEPQPVTTNGDPQ